MSLQLLMNLNGSKRGQLYRYLHSLDREPRIAWYPSAGGDFRALMYLDSKYSALVPPTGPEPAPPDIFLFSDYSTIGVNEYSDGTIVFQDEFTTITIESAEELPRLNLPLNTEITHEWKSWLTDSTFFIIVSVESTLLGTYQVPVICVYAQNETLFCEKMHPCNARFSHIVHVRYGGGCGGGGFAAGTWLMNILSQVHCEVYVTDGQHGWQSGDQHMLESCNAVPVTCDVELYPIREIPGGQWSNHGDVTWNILHEANRMTISNIENTRDVPDSVIKHVYRLAQAFDAHHLNKGVCIPVTMTELLCKVPMVLLSDSAMQEYDRMFQMELKEALGPFELSVEDIKRSKYMELYGFYAHTSKLLGEQQPVVGLCPERIHSDWSGNDGSNREYEIVTAEVIIHEYAHALMAVQAGSASCADKDSTWLQYRFWIEEAMANAVTLQCFVLAPDDQRHETEHFVREQMLKQLSPYAFGVHVHDASLTDPWKWSTLKTAHHWQWLTESQDDLLQRQEKQQNQFKQHEIVKRAISIVQTMRANHDVVQPVSSGELFIPDIQTIVETQEETNGYHKTSNDALLRSALAGNIKGTIDALSRRASVNARDINGWTALHHAAAGGAKRSLSY